MAAIMSARSPVYYLQDQQRGRKLFIVASYWEKPPNQRRYSFHLPGLAAGHDILYFKWLVGSSEGGLYDLGPEELSLDNAVRNWVVSVEFLPASSTAFHAEQRDYKRRIRRPAPYLPLLSFKLKPPAELVYELPGAPEVPEI